MKKRNFELKSLSLNVLLLALFCMSSLFVYAQGEKAMIKENVKKVIVLDSNEEIPQEIQKELVAMGFALPDVKNKLKAAKQGIVLRKPVGKIASIQQYTGASLQAESAPYLSTTETIELKETQAFCNHKGPGCNCGIAKPVLGVLVSNHEKGAEIDKVIEYSAASEAGLLQRDVVTEINGNKITSNYSLIKLIKAQEPGDKVKIKFLRNGKKMRTSAVLKAQKMKSKGSSYSKHHSNGYRAQEDCETLCNAPLLGVLISTDAGAKVNSVFPNTGAASAELRKGDVITSIDNVDVESSPALISAVSQYAPGDKVTLKFIREGNTQKVRTTISNKAAIRSKTTCDCEQLDFKKEVDKEIIILKSSESPLLFDEPAPTQPKASAKKNTLEVSAVALYPNPNDGAFTIDFALEDALPVTISVVDLVGREVFKQQLAEFSGNHQQKIDISMFAPGSYFLNIIQGENSYSKKFIYNR